MIRHLEQALDALSRREKVVANNLANVDTPGYTRSDVDFFSYMKQVLAGNEPTLTVAPDQTTAARLDGNNVNLEQEIFALTQTDTMYGAVSRLASDDVRMLTYAATDGRG